MKHILSVAFLFLSIALQSADIGKVAGKIIDRQTKQPVEGVNIYISKTTIGTSTNGEGEFNLDKIPPGRYTLIISHLSYENQDHQIYISKETSIDLQLELTPRPIEFPEIDVTDKYDTEWWDNFDIFSEALLGSTWFAGGCEIVNPFYISFEKNEDGVLFATSEVPIEIENRSLGYYITYSLQHFEHKFRTTKYAGFPFFEEMSSDFAEDSLVWKGNRLEAYMGSLRHFLRALSDYYSFSKEEDELLDEVTFFQKHGFYVFLNHLYSTASGERHSIKEFYVSQTVEQSERPNELVLICGNQIQVEYFKEYQELNYEPQLSYLRLHSDSVYFDKHGRYHDEFKIQTMGYMQKQRLAEMLPFEYEPSDSVLFNTDFR